MKNAKLVCALPVTAGVLLVILGLFAILAPALVVKILPITLGLFVLAFGVYELTTGYRKRAAEPLFLPRCVQGIASVAVGLVLVLNRKLSVMFLGVVLGFWGIVSGVISLRMTAQYRKQNLPGSYWDGVLKIVLGCVMLAFPFGGMAAWTAVLGWFALFAGICALVSSYFLYKMTKAAALEISVKTSFSNSDDL